MRAPREMNEPAEPWVTPPCRHCGAELEWMPGGFWCDLNGFTACVKAPVGGTFVTHLPMPVFDGMATP